MGSAASRLQKSGVYNKRPRVSAKHKGIKKSKTVKLEMPWLARAQYSLQQLVQQRDSVVKQRSKAHCDQDMLATS